MFPNPKLRVFYLQDGQIFVTSCRISGLEFWCGFVFPVFLVFRSHFGYGSSGIVPGTHDVFSNPGTTADDLRYGQILVFFVEVVGRFVY